MNNKTFDITTPRYNDDTRALICAINQGIDSRLEGFTQSEFYWEDFYDCGKHTRLVCKIAIDELQIMIRRLLESNDDTAISLADNIVYVQWGFESV